MLILFAFLALPAIPGILVAAWYISREDRAIMRELKQRRDLRTLNTVRGHDFYCRWEHDKAEIGCPDANDLMRNY